MIETCWRASRTEISLILSGIPIVLRGRLLENLWKLLVQSTVQLMSALCIFQTKTVQTGATGRESLGMAGIARVAGCRRIIAIGVHRGWQQEVERECQGDETEQPRDNYFPVQIHIAPPPKE